MGEWRGQSTDLALARPAPGARGLRRRNDLGTWPGRELQGLVLFEDALMQRLGGRSGFDTELVAQSSPQAAVDLQCLGLATRSDRGEHRRPMAPFAEGMVAGEGGCQSECLVSGRSGACGHQRRRQLVDRLCSGLLQSCAIGHDEVVAHPLKGVRTAPYGYGITVCRDRTGGVPGRGGLTGPAQCRVEVIRVDLDGSAEAVASVMGLDAVAAQRSAQSSDHGVHSRRREIPCRVAPHQVEQGVGCDDVAPALEQHGEDVSRPLAARRRLAVRSFGQERPQHADTHSPIESQQGPGCA